MKKNLVSIIVPVYNSEKYLTECIESIINQTYKNIEVILVDDFSPDNSFEICERFAKKDNRIKFFRKQKNEGVSEARNFGLQKSKGDYICFVDSDDYLENNYVECLLLRAQEGDLDLTFCRYNVVLGETVTKLYELSLEQFVKNKQYKYYFDKSFKQSNKPNIKDDCNLELSKVTFSACWRTLYKKDFLTNNNISFVKDLFYGEDLIFVVSCLIKTNKVDVVDKFLYNYRESLNSITRSFNFKFVEQVEKFSKIFFELIGSTLQPDEKKYYYYSKGVVLLYKALSFGTKKDVKLLMNNNFIKSCFSKENYKVYKSTLTGIKAKLPIMLFQYKMFGLYKLLKKIFKKS